VYFSSDDGNIYAISPDGEKKWTLYLGISCEKPVIGREGTIYVATIGAYDVYAISSDGKIKWDYDSYFGKPSYIAIGSDGGLYFATDEGYLLSLGPSDSAGDSGTGDGSTQNYPSSTPGFETIAFVLSLGGAVPTHRRKNL